MFCEIYRKNLSITEKLWCSTNQGGVSKKDNILNALLARTSEQECEQILTVWITNHFITKTWNGYKEKRK